MRSVIRALDAAVVLLLAAHLTQRSAAAAAADENGRARRMLRGAAAGATDGVHRQLPPAAGELMTPTANVVQDAMGRPVYVIDFIDYDYVPGGVNQGVNYFDTTPANEAGDVWRPAQAVDADDVSVIFTALDEWQQFTVGDHFPAGLYRIDLTAGAPADTSGGSLQLDFYEQPGANEGVDPIDTVPLKHGPTGGWANYVAARGPQVQLPAGPWTVRATLTEEGMNLKDLRFVLLEPAA